METLEYMYRGKIVEFFFQEDIMVNATEMAAVFNSKHKRVAEFLRLESTIEWISWLENNAIRANRSGESPLRFSGNAVLQGEIKHRSVDLVPILTVVRGGESGGASWMHRLLAIEFAMWLDIDFKGWIILKIDQLLFDYSIGKRHIAIRRKDLKEERMKIFSENHNNDLVKRILEIDTELDQLKGEELNLNKNFNKTL
jgi:hypothetical protein